MSSGFVPAEDQPPEAPENLQFERVEPSASGVLPVPGGHVARRCWLCGQELFDTYFEIDSRLACVPCRDRFEEQWRGGSGAARFLKALAAGCGAGVLGAILYYGIRAATGYDFGLIAVVVGVMVGKAVRWGSAGRGGRGYQVLAMLLTYLAIGSTYLPDAMEGVAKQAAKEATAPASPAAPGSPRAAAAPAAGKAAGKPAEEKGRGAFRSIFLGLAALLLLAAALPILVGVQSPFVLVIVAIGLYEAWKMSRPADGERVTGPFTLGTRAPLPPVG
jgi:hypothetical protein